MRVIFNVPPPLSLSLLPFLLLSYCQVCSWVHQLWYILTRQWCLELWYHIVGDVLLWRTTLRWNDWSWGKQRYHITSPKDLFTVWEQSPGNYTCTIMDILHSIVCMCVCDICQWWFGTCPLKCICTSQSCWNHNLPVGICIHGCERGALVRKIGLRTSLTISSILSVIMSIPLPHPLSPPPPSLSLCCVW